MPLTMLRRLLVGAVVGVLALIVVPHQPAAASDQPMVQITLTAVSPTTISGPTDRVTITGRVTNTSTVAMRQVQVSFWRQIDPITSPADLATTLETPWDYPLGQRMGSAEPDLNLDDLTDTAHPVLAPGASAAFTVSALVSDLGLPTANAVYLLGVHVRAIPDRADNQTVGRSRVVVPYVAPDARQPTRLPVATLVPLTSRPSLIASGVLSDNHLAGELTGRLHDLLTAAERPGATFLIDPNLVDEVATMARGYRTTDGVDTTQGRAAATAFLPRLQKLIATRHGYRLPYGNPDVTLAVAAGRTDVFTRAAGALTGAHPTAHLPLAALPFEGAISTGLMQALERAGVQVVFAHGTGLAAPATVGRLVVVPLAATPFAGGPGPDPHDTEPQIATRLASQLLVDGTSGRRLVLLVGSPAEARWSTSLPAWTVPTLVSDLVAKAQPARPLVPATLEARPGWAPLWDELDAMLTDYADLAQLTLTPDRTTLVANQVASRALSLGFQGSRTDTVAWLSNAHRQAAVPFAPGTVRLQAVQNFVLSSATASLPVRVTNTWSQPIRVRVRFTSENPQRIEIPDTPAVVVPPGETVTVFFTPRAHTNGAVSVRAELVTVGGRSLGGDHGFTVTATNLGAVGWAIIVASGLVLLLVTAWRIRQVRQQGGRDDPAPQPATAAATALTRSTTVSRLSRTGHAGQTGPTSPDTPSTPSPAEEPHDP